MSLLTQLQAALRTVAAGGAFYGANTLELNDKTVYPFVVYTLATSNTNNTLAGASALQSARVQVDVIAPSLADLEPTSDAVAAALVAASFKGCWQLTSGDAYEPEIRAYRRTTDFSIWYLV